MDSRRPEIGCAHIYWYVAVHAPLRRSGRKGFMNLSGSPRGRLLLGRDCWRCCGCGHRGRRFCSGECGRARDVCCTFCALRSIATPTAQPVEPISRADHGSTPPMQRLPLYARTASATPRPSSRPNHSGADAPAPSLRSGEPRRLRRREKLFSKVKGIGLMSSAARPLHVLRV